jgi:hypothetical protein
MNLNSHHVSFGTLTSNLTSGSSEARPGARFSSGAFGASPVRRASILEFLYRSGMKHMVTTSSAGVSSTFQRFLTRSCISCM